jgi:hypothetical protein
MTSRRGTVARFNDFHEARGGQGLARVIRECHADDVDPLGTPNLRQEVAEIVQRPEHGDADVRPFRGPVPRLSHGNAICGALDDPDRHPHHQFSKTVAEPALENDRDSAAHPRAVALSAGDAVVVGRLRKRRRTCSLTLSASAKAQSFTPRRTM